MKEIKVVQIPKQEIIIEPIIETSNIKVVSIPKQELTTDIEIPSTSSIRVTTEGPSVEEIINRFLSGDISEEEYNKLLSEVIIRFNTEPKRYEKADYRKLIQAIIGLRRILEERIKDCEDRIIECEKRLDDHDDILKDHEGRITELEKLEITSSEPDTVAVERNGMKFKIIPQLSGEVTDTPTEGEDKKIATVSSIRNYINNKLNWNVI